MWLSWRAAYTLVQSKLKSLHRDISDSLQKAISQEETFLNNISIWQVSYYNKKIAIMDKYCQMHVTKGE